MSLLPIPSTAVAAVATTLANDQPVLVTAGEDQLVSIEDLRSMPPMSTSVARDE
jgi:hypothetical protein